MCLLDNGFLFSCKPVSITLFNDKSYFDSWNDESRTKCDGRGDAVKKYQNGNGNTKHGTGLPSITSSDQMSCNAMIHTIDHVMLPVYLHNSPGW